MARRPPQRTGGSQAAMACRKAAPTADRLGMRGMLNDLLVGAGDEGVEALVQAVAALAVRLLHGEFGREGRLADVPDRDRGDGAVGKGQGQRGGVDDVAEMLAGARVPHKPGPAGSGAGGTKVRDDGEDVAAALDRIVRPKGLGPAVVDHMGHGQHRPRQKRARGPHGGKKAKLESGHPDDARPFHRGHRLVASG